MKWLIIFLISTFLWSRSDVGNSFLQKGMAYECVVTGEYGFNRPRIYTNRQILARDMVPLTRFDAVRINLGNEVYKYLRSENYGGKQVDIYGNSRRWIKIDNIRFKVGRVFHFDLHFRNGKRATKIITCFGYPKGGKNDSKNNH